MAEQGLLIFIIATYLILHSRASVYQNKLKHNRKNEEPNVPTRNLQADFPYDPTNPIMKYFHDYYWNNCTSYTGVSGVLSFKTEIDSSVKPEIILHNPFCFQFVKELNNGSLSETVNSKTANKFSNAYEETEIDFKYDPLNPLIIDMNHYWHAWCEEKYYISTSLGYFFPYSQLPYRPTYFHLQKYGCVNHVVGNLVSTDNSGEVKDPEIVKDMNSQEDTESGEDAEEIEILKDVSLPEKSKSLEDSEVEALNNEEDLESPQNEEDTEDAENSKDSLEAEESENPQNQDESENPQNSEESENPQNAEETENPQDSEKTENSQNAEETDNPQNSEETEYPQNAEEIENSPNSEESENPQNAEETENPQKAEEIENSQNSEESENPQNAEETENPQKAEETENPQNSEETENPQNAEETENSELEPAKVSMNEIDLDTPKQSEDEEDMEEKEDAKDAEEVDDMKSSEAVEEPALIVFE